MYTTTTTLPRSHTVPSRIDELSGFVPSQLKRSQSFHPHANRSTSLSALKSPYDENNDYFGVSGFFPTDHHEQRQWGWLHDDEEVGGNDAEGSDSDYSLPATPAQPGQTFKDEDAGEAIRKEDKLGFVSFFGKSAVINE